MTVINKNIRDSTLKKGRLGRASIWDNSEKNSEITDNINDSGIMRGKAFWLLEVGWEQILWIEKHMLFPIKCI